MNPKFHGAKNLIFVIHNQMLVVNWLNISVGHSRYCGDGLRRLYHGVRGVLVAVGVGACGQDGLAERLRYWLIILSELTQRLT